ncbi:rRNA adenine N(6)-methyltransferase family protein [Phytoactinopolyspora halotolerans]|uniref:Methyltransferase domain-containing protein n=1 Tax=Phytoactinopolyspora halotolerans TaxID=1981512 RepID=A0A6L9S9T7_9ACTN|nr:rRNA adenine N(6)-methyltransferase family protein [Phytoactinopolyspora halotolerans]NEE01332.1 methyltransferase domain-containing protein [Phytoactinopolyspora halotolerans]
MPSRTHRKFSSDNRPGIHILRDRAVLRRLVQSASPGAGDIVVEFGAGTGVLTAALAQTGARVIAVERSPAFVARLRRRFPPPGNVRVVQADAREVILPRQPYVVVANIPYSISTALLRRLLTPTASGLTAADLIVEWGFAKRVTAAEPRDFEVAWWQLRYQIEIVRRIPRRSFTPEPSVDSAQLRIRRRRDLRAAELDRRRRELRAAYRRRR